MARARKAAKKTSRRKAPKRQAAARKIARKRAKTSRTPKAAARRKAARPTRKARPVAKARKAVRKPARPARSAKPRPERATESAKGGSILNRIRRQLAEEERMGAAAAARQDDHLNAQAVSGRGALRAELSRHTDGGPALTAGDVDARWQDAYAVGDEAPGGDNPTPDQDRVDDIGKALGIQYQDGQELQGGEEVLERDRHRWEYDPASSEDWPHDKKS